MRHVCGECQHFVYTYKSPYIITTIHGYCEIRRFISINASHSTSCKDYVQGINSKILVGSLSRFSAM